MRITLCGSARFYELFYKLNRDLSLAGHVVYSLGAYPDKESSKDWMTPEQKVVLDLVHLAKIENSEMILVIDPEGYIGESTRKEIHYALLRHKAVWFYSAGIVDKLIDQSPNIVFEQQSPRVATA